MGAPVARTDRGSRWPSSPGGHRDRGNGASANDRLQATVTRLAKLGGATLFLLDEPTDNLDLPSADALQAGLEAHQGTVFAVTHDRWFAASFDRFLVFAPDGTVKESPSPVWD